MTEERALTTEEWESLSVESRHRMKLYHLTFEVLFERLQNADRQLAALSWAAWVSVAKRLPEEGGYYLAAGMYKGNISWVNELYFSDDYEWFHGGNERHSVTHWMSLPPSPANIAKEI